MNKSYGLYKLLSPPITVEKLEQSYLDGLIKKDELKDGVYYQGHCRNASIAVWNQGKQRFTYLRHKFGSSYKEDIVHPVDDEGFDIFTPFREMGDEVLKKDMESLQKECVEKDTKTNQRDFKDFSNLLDSWFDVQEFKVSIHLELMVKSFPFAFENTQKKWVKKLIPLLYNASKEDQNKIASSLLVMGSSLGEEFSKEHIKVEKSRFPETVPSFLAQLIRQYGIGEKNEKI